MKDAGPAEYEAAVPLPNAAIIPLAPGVNLQPPLSRRGHGPGMIIVVPDSVSSATNGHTRAEILTPLQKWAEEGFSVVEIKGSAISTGIWSIESLQLALNGLDECPSCDRGQGVGLIVYDPALWHQVKAPAEVNERIVSSICYGVRGEYELASSSKPFLWHLPGEGKIQLPEDSRGKVYEYPRASSPLFAFPGHSGFNYASEAVSHTRNLDFMKKLIGAPYFDLEKIWEEHTYYEFENRSVEKTMGTMVQEPYVNHIPTMTGGVGRKNLTDFYAHHFIWNNPKDTELDLVSRTIGVDRICDEFIFSFTHDMEVDWLIPGIPPTGKKLSIPFTSIVNIRGDRLYHEHIAWDQATVLVQLGLMPEYLPYPHDLPGGSNGTKACKFEFRVPAAGVETAKKMLDKSSVPSNGMFKYGVREASN